MERQKTQKNQHNIEKNKVVGLTVSNFKTSSETTVIKTLCYWKKNRQVNGIESPETNSHKYS